MKEQFKPKEDSFIFYEIPAILTLRSSKKLLRCCFFARFFIPTCHWMLFPMQGSADEAAIKQKGYSLSRQTLSSFPSYFLILDCAESSTKTLRVTSTLQFPLCGSDLE